GHRRMPTHPIVLRAFSIFAGQTNGEEAASIWMEAARNAAGSQAAFAATMAGRLLLREGKNADDALRMALEFDGGYRPALWLLECGAQKAGDVALFHEIKERISGVEEDAASRLRRSLRTYFTRDLKHVEGALYELEKAYSEKSDDLIIAHMIGELST